MSDAKAGSFREQECKLNAPSRNQVEKVWNFVLSDSHYMTDTDPSFREPWLADLHLSAPQERTALRERIYCDSRRLLAAQNGIDIRLEDPFAAGKTKQMIKIPTAWEKAQGGQAVSSADVAMDRMELSFKLKGKGHTPDLTVLPEGPSKWLKRIFDVSSLKDVSLYPLLQIVTQRSKMRYYPGGDHDTQIELAMDIGRGRTCFGQTWPVFQIELEMVKGDAANLQKEADRLMSVFPFLVIETRSKPTPGFELLDPLLARKDIREHLKDQMKQSRGTEFQILPMPALSKA